MNRFRAPPSVTAPVKVSGSIPEFLALMAKKTRLLPAEAAVPAPVADAYALRFRRLSLMSRFVAAQSTSRTATELSVVAEKRDRNLGYAYVWADDLEVSPAVRLMASSSNVPGPGVVPVLPAPLGAGNVLPSVEPFVPHDPHMVRVADPTVAELAPLVVGVYPASGNPKIHVEVKLLHHLRVNLPAEKRSVVLFTERTPCASCRNLIRDYLTLRSEDDLTIVYAELEAKSRSARQKRADLVAACQGRLGFVSLREVRNRHADEP